MILDGCAVLYHIHWPKDARVKDFVDAFIEYVKIICKLHRCT